MSSSVNFSSALSQFGYASRDLALATVKYPFSGGWKRLVLAGPPVLLLTSGLGAVIFTVMNRSIRGVAGACYNGSKKIYRDFFASRSVAPKETRASQPSASRTAILPNQPQPKTPAPVRVPLAPLPIEAAKERNEAFIKLLPLIEKYAIDPMMKKKSLFKGIDCTDDSLKNWLKSMSLWSLGMAWDKLECFYVNHQTPSVDKVETIIAHAKQIDPRLGVVFEEYTTSTTNPVINSNHQDEKKIEAILLAIAKSRLPESKATRLAALYFKLQAIQDGAPAPIGSQVDDQNEIRKKFALFMNCGIANTLAHMPKIVEGWITVWNNGKNPPSPAPVDSPADAPQDAVEESAESTIVKDVSDAVRENVTTKYFMPLWDKKSKEWDVKLQSKLPPEGLEFFNDYMSTGMDEKKFLENEMSHLLSTEQASMVFFMRAVKSMDGNVEGIQNSINNVLDMGLTLISPVLTETLIKSSKMLSQISFERSVPKFADYFIKLLQFCETMRKARDAQDSLNSSFVYIHANESSPFIGVLQRVEQGNDFKDLDLLYKTIPHHISGKTIIERFPSDSIHQVVRSSFDSTLHEKEWIRLKKEELKTILRLSTDKYVREEGNWISRIFNAIESGEPANFVHKLLNFFMALRGNSVIDNLMTFLFAGVEAILENMEVEAAQNSLNELTSTGYLSTTIATSFVKALISKEDEKWVSRLPKLQQAYSFLQPDEKELVLKHLAVQCEGEAFEKRKQLLVNFNSEQASNIEAMIDQEDKCKDATDRLFKALALTPAGKDYDLIQEAYEKIKRERDLLQFNRMRALVACVTDKILDETFTFVGGGAIKKICIGLIHEFLALLTCQELVKHWIFTIVDLIIEELKAGSQRAPAANAGEHLEAVSLLDLIGTEQRQLLLGSLSGFMQATEKDSSWMELSKVTATLFSTVVNWSPDTIWGYIYAYNEKFKITPPQLSDKIITAVGDFGKDPNGLPDLIINALTGLVADPRQETKNLPAL